VTSPARPSPWRSRSRRPGHECNLRHGRPGNDWPVPRNSPKSPFSVLIWLTDRLSCFSAVSWPTSSYPPQVKATTGNKTPRNCKTMTMHKHCMLISKLRRPSGCRIPGFRVDSQQNTAANHRGCKHGAHNHVTLPPLFGFCRENYACPFPLVSAPALRAARMRSLFVPLQKTIEQQNSKKDKP